MENEIESIREKLKLFNLREVSRKTNIKYPTLYAFASGKNISPSYKTVKALSDFLKNTAEEMVG